MKFLVDAQLPKEISLYLQSKNFDSIHTLDLPLKNSTPDNEINRISLEEKRIVITKDTDFINSIKFFQKPYKLLLITTGNISNKHFKDILVRELNELISLFKTHSFIELTRDSIIIHD
jgi:predicted nuclease of predicted toxin-antitoxin system